MVLRIAGDLDDIEGEASTVMVHREPLDLARSLVSARGVKLAELEMPIGHDAPVGRRFSTSDVESAVRAIEATLCALDPDNASAEPGLQELSRALALFRTAQAYARAVTLEV